MISYPCTLVVIGLPKPLLTGMFLDGVQRIAVPPLFEEVSNNAYTISDAKQLKDFHEYLSTKLNVSDAHFLNRDNTVILLATPKWKTIQNKGVE